MQLRDQAEAARLSELEQAADPVAKLGEYGTLPKSEDGSEDHLQGDRLHRRPQREGAAQRPSIHLVRGDVRHQRQIALHSVAVERGQHQPALAHVLGAIEQEDRMAAERRLQHAVGLAGVHPVAVVGEHRPDQIGVADAHHLAADRQVDDEGVAVALPAPLDKLGKAELPQQRLHRHRQPRTGRQPIRRCRRARGSRQHAAHRSARSRPATTPAVRIRRISSPSRMEGRRVPVCVPSGGCPTGSAGAVPGA